MPNPISPQRQQLNTIATVVGVIGLLLFLSTFVSGALSFGDFTDFEDRTRSMALRAVVGMIMMIAGGAMKALAIGGAAGSGLVLDPDRAREELKPWARLSGGLTKDQLDEMGIDIPHIVESLTNRTTASGETFADRLRSLHALHKEGILSEEEYNREKQELLDQA